ncbi:MAG: PQQ-dependent sugar dehydrogenase [Patescibacteria group bacterium]|jgi:glucose/arabinose dehydrogenase
MKRPLLILGGLILVGLIAAGGVFYWKQLRGAGPALSPATGDIAGDIETVPKPQEHGEATATADVIGENTTNMPLTLPDGVSVSIFAKGLGGARDLYFAPNGTMLVSVPSDGKVLRLDPQTSGPAKPVAIIEGLNQPHGLAMFCDDFDSCRLFVAETNAVRVYEYDPETSEAKNGKKILDISGGGGHWSRSLLIHNDKLYISIGSTCNVCREKDEQRASVMVANLDGSEARVYAKGLRNAVFLAENPQTNDVWVTEMGRDLLGDNIPPEELNILKDGGNYGWPNCYGNNIHDAAFDKNTYIRNPCMEPFETAPAVEMQAHSAPLGLAFFPPEWPKEYRDDALVAFHGSWNRTTPTGYKLRRIKLDAKGRVEGQDDFVTGWLNAKNEALGRPVDVLFYGKDLYVSDDKAGVVYLFRAP